MKANERQTGMSIPRRHFLSTKDSHRLPPVEKIITKLVDKEPYGGWHEQDGTTLTIFIDKHYPAKYQEMVRQHEIIEHYFMHRLGFPYYKAHIHSLHMNEHQFGKHEIMSLVAFTRDFLYKKSYIKKAK